MIPFQSVTDSLGVFLQATNWPAPTRPWVRSNMQVALSFFHELLPGWINRPLSKDDKGYRRHGPGPWSFGIRGVPTKLTAAMQAIDFTHGVTRVRVPIGQKLIRYAKAGTIDKSPTGLWYAAPGTPASQLALPPDQTEAQNFVVITDAIALKSVAGDLLVDWGMTPEARRLLRYIDYHYCHGGGVQYTIPSASKYLQPA